MIPHTGYGVAHQELRNYGTLRWRSVNGVFEFWEVDVNRFAHSAYTTRWVLIVHGAPTSLWWRDNETTPDCKPDWLRQAIEHARITTDCIDLYTGDLVRLAA